MINFILMHKSKKLFKMSNTFGVLFYLSFSCGSFHALIKDIMTRIQLFFCACLLSFSTTSYAQWANKPKLVVGIVVDQMRYDYLYKYWDKYSEGGFKRLIKEGFSYENMNYNYVPTATGPGHSTIYSGAPPSVSGIAGNDWYDRKLKKRMYVCDDSTVQKVGGSGGGGKMSAKNLLTTTITDELKLFSNRRSKVIGISLKDRASILPAGHLADAAYWFDSPSGEFVSSTAYLKALPKWVQDWNARKEPDAFLSKTWNTLLPIEQYVESTADDMPNEQAYSGEGNKPVFPYDLPKIRGAKGGYDLLTKTPFGNTLVADFAKEAILQENMGGHGLTDFLCVSFSSTDIVGHQFGPDAIEVEDVYLRLDQDLKKFLSFLDAKIGKESVLVFLTADHAAAHNPGYLKSIGAPAGYFDSKTMLDSLKQFLAAQYGTSDLFEYYEGQQVYLNTVKIKESKLSKPEVARAIANYLTRFAGVQGTYTSEDLLTGSSLNPMFGKIQLGWYPNRSGDLFIQLQSGWYDAPEGAKGTTHGSTYQYDTHVPMLWYGWKIKPGKSHESVNITDIAPTVAGMLQIMGPSGSIGKVLTEVVPK